MIRFDVKLHKTRHSIHPLSRSNYLTNWQVGRRLYFMCTIRADVAPEHNLIQVRTVRTDVFLSSNRIIIIFFGQEL